ncbi:MAG: hypothetical protein IJE05_06155 [Clostridia bacterium]|nr:hypothetical protein [Clostridia bacterium]
MKCPKCGENNSQIINEVTTTGKDFSAGKGCCGAILMGPIGILCGACGEGKQTHNNQYWVCNNCGNKWRT